MRGNSAGSRMARSPTFPCYNEDPINVVAKRNCPGNPDASSFINRSPLSDRCWCREGDTDQDCTIRWINRSLPPFSLGPNSGELWRTLASR